MNFHTWHDIIPPYLGQNATWFWSTNIPINSILISLLITTSLDKVPPQLYRQNFNAWGQMWHATIYCVSGTRFMDFQTKYVFHLFFVYFYFYTKWVYMQWTLVGVAAEIHTTLVLFIYMSVTSWKVNLRYLDPRYLDLIVLSHGMSGSTVIPL